MCIVKQITDNFSLAHGMIQAMAIGKILRLTKESAVLRWLATWLQK